MQNSITQSSSQNTHAPKALSHDILKLTHKILLAYQAYACIMYKPTKMVLLNGVQDKQQALL